MIASMKIKRSRRAWCILAQAKNPATFRRIYLSPSLDRKARRITYSGGPSRENCSVSLDTELDIHRVYMLTPFHLKVKVKVHPTTGPEGPRGGIEV
jgi:hypothetical protein